MTVRVATFMLVLCCCSALPRPASADESRPCDITNVIVDSTRSVLVRCNEVEPDLPATAKLFKVNAGPAGDPRITLTEVADLTVTPVTTQAGVVPQWRRFTIASTATLDAGARYFLHIPPDAGRAPAAGGAWEPFWRPFATRAAATIEDAAASINSGRILMLAASIAIANPSAAPRLFVTRDGKRIPLPATFVVSAPAPIAPDADPDTIGRVTITLTGSRLPVSAVKLTVEGLSDVFGNPVSPAASSRTEIFGRNLSGKTRDEVDTYLRLGHEAGRNRKPAWTLDAQTQVELPVRPGGWRVTPMGSADIGFGSAATTNTVKLGVGFTRFDLIGRSFQDPRRSPVRRGPREPLLQGARFTIAPTFETDRDFDKRNLLADVDVELFFRNLYNPIRTQNRRLLEHARAQDPGVRMEDIAGSSFGWVVTFVGGAELGGALYDQRETFDTLGGALPTTVEAPAHGIARIRAKASVLLEFKRVSLGMQGIGRWLATEEHALQSARGIFVRRDFDGVQGFAQVTLSVALSERTSLDSTYKVGRLPPLYPRVSIVQTGVAFRF